MTVYRTTSSYCHVHQSGEGGEKWDVGKVMRKVDGKGGGRE